MLLANRAFAHIKLENYGSALEDSTVAIQYSPNYAKVNHVNQICSKRQNGEVINKLLIRHITGEVAHNSHCEDMARH